MTRRLNESKDRTEYVARLEDGRVLYRGKLDYTFKMALTRLIYSYADVDDAIFDYLRSCGYSDLDEWEYSELADAFVDSFNEDDRESFISREGFTIVPAENIDTVGESVRRFSRRDYRRKYR